MENRLSLPSSYKISCLVLVAIGGITFVFGFLTEPIQAWANWLLNSYYFVSLTLGALFFSALQYVTQAGWSASFKRIPEAMGSWLPIGFFMFLIALFGVHQLFHWSHHDAVATDHLLAHKAPYLNLPFLAARLILFFGLWIFLFRKLRKLSLEEDVHGGLVYFEKQEYYSKILIFVLAITVSFFAVDWLMSLEPHWFSTLFAARSFISSLYHASTIIALVVIVLHKRGYFPRLNRSHMHDFSRYIFMASIVWGYFWFAEFMLIWYGNIPEETVYYVVRWDMQWKPWVFVSLFLNWFVPFIVLMPRKTSRSTPVIIPVILLLVVGQWLELYLQIMPATTGENSFGLIEIGSFVGFAGLYALVIAGALKRAPLIAKNHPYLEESLHHHF